ncbi:MULTISPECIES: YkvA family protein [Hyphomonas]|uniref:DUF1232 domain-containing protein n=2 Tax=Hyphomonas adhaerens TaxID=81029 RepID=A0A069E3S4_9PROT|nr:MULTISPECIES: YkvA family protein [Hyphomonas]KCZ84509.1 hypothetical protein HAD_02480 [Hyphomonas adhaerens MHS-3]MBB39805.1 DUF1232 domain-containing protein [Hyphomonas sp.]HAE27383.1 DUF1232 domain-containing protein [Hyphomonas adhaerens]|tara:strand:- start:3 stop:401 length:399 start_codon:yes stop_codon:yes gene_type:complete
MSDAAEVINTVLNEDGRYIPKSIERDERTSRGLIPKLMRMVGRIPFADDLVAAWFAARDPHTPTRAKAVLFAAVAYFVTPMDLLPDFITGLGFTDDATVLATALGLVGMHVKETHRAAARRILRVPEPVNED